MAFKGGFISLIAGGSLPTSLVEHSCWPLHLNIPPLSQNVTVAPGTNALETVLCVLRRSPLQYTHQEKAVERHLRLSLFQAGGGDSPQLVETDCFPS